MLSTIPQQPLILSLSITHHLPLVMMPDAMRPPRELRKTLVEVLQRVDVPPLQQLAHNAAALRHPLCPVSPHTIVRLKSRAKRISLGDLPGSSGA